MREQGLRWHLMREIEERGAEAVIDDAIAEALDGPDAIYLSLDIDVIDPGMAPGTGTPEPGGMLTREVLRAVRQIVGAVELAGMDIVEVSPPYDQAETTAMAANRAALEAISALAVKRQAGQRRPLGGLTIDPCGARPTRRRDRGGARAPVRPRPGRRPGRPRPLPRPRRPDRRADPGACRRDRPPGRPARRGRLRRHRRRPRPGDARPGPTARRGDRPRRRPTLTLVEADVVGLRLPDAGTFGLAFIALNSLLVLPTRAAQRAARPRAGRSPRARRPGGRRRLAPRRRRPRPLRRPDRARVAAARPGDRRDRDQGRLRASTTRPARPSTLTTIFEEGGQGEPARRWVRRDRLRLVSADELRGVRRGRRADRRAVAGGYDMGPIGPGSERAILLARQALTTRPCDRPMACHAGTGTSGSGPATDPRGIVEPMPSSDQTRLLIVEDVPQVAQYIRGLLNSQATGQAARRPDRRRRGAADDQGAATGRRPRRRAAPGPGQGPAARRADPRGRAGRPGHRPDRAAEPGRAGPGDGHPRRPVDAVLGLRPDDPDRPGAQGLRGSSRRSPATRLMSVFAPKGGVGKTTIAFNLAVALGAARPADRADRRQPPVRRPALAAQGARRRAVDPRPADRPDRRSRTWATSCGATRRASTSCSRRRASRWRRCSRRATSRRCCRCCAGSTA